MYTMLPSDHLDKRSDGRRWATNGFVAPSVNLSQYGRAAACTASPGSETGRAARCRGMRARKHRADQGFGPEQEAKNWFF